MLFFDDSIRVPVGKEEKKNFQTACRATNGKLMAPVLRDLMSGFTKAVRKAMVFPGNYEAPNYNEILSTAVKKEGVSLWTQDRR